MRLSKVLYGIMLCIVILLTYFRAVGVVESNTKKVQNLAEIYAERIQNVIQDVETNIKHLEGFFKLKHYYFSQQDFEEISSFLFKKEYFILMSYQPSGIIRYVYPSEPFQGYIGVNLLEDESTKGEALYAKDSGNTVFVGPTKVMDYEGIIARRPIMVEREDMSYFWGFLTIAFDAKKLLTDVVEVEALDNFDYGYSIDTLYRGKFVTTLQSKEFDSEKAYKYEFTVGEQTWALHLYYKKLFYELYTSVAFFFVLYFIIVTCIYLLIRKYESKSLHSEKLSYTDALTKVYNRKMAEEYMELHKDDIENGFTIFYIDLNDFKPVNDTHGHEVGDQLLIAFVERTKHKFKQDTKVIRMGGDEFAIIINESLNEAALNSVITRIDTLSKDPFYLNGLRVQISSSIGYAEYPKNGTTMTELLVLADERMYAWKKRVKAERVAQQEATQQEAAQQSEVPQSA